MLGAREHPSGKIVQEKEQRVRMLGEQLVDACKKYPQAIPKELWCVTIGFEEYPGNRIEADILDRRKKYKYLAVSSSLASATNFVFKWLLLVTSRDKKKSKGSNGLVKVAIMLGEPLTGTPAPGTHVVEFGWRPDLTDRTRSRRYPVLAFPILEVVDIGTQISVSVLSGLMYLSISLLVKWQSRRTKEIAIGE